MSDVFVTESFDDRIIEEVKRGQLAVVPTDTIYGVVCSALNAEAVERTYRVCKRDLDKPFIVSIASIEDLKLFGIEIEEQTRQQTRSFWPGEVSVVFECKQKEYRYLHRELGSIAFRLSGDQEYTDFLKRTGPLATTSANPQGSPQANSIKEAKAYFEDEIFMYVDKGIRESRASTLVKIDGDSVEVLRQGSVRINK